MSKVSFKPEIGMGEVERRNERDFFLGGDRFVASFGAELFLLPDGGGGSGAVDTGEILKCGVVVMVASPVINYAMLRVCDSPSNCEGQSTMPM